MASSIIVFYDPLTKKKFSLGTSAKRMQAFGGNPIWDVAEKQGVKTSFFFLARI
jgi:alkaline phosphatase D